MYLVTLSLGLVCHVMAHISSAAMATPGLTWELAIVLVLRKITSLSAAEISFPEPFCAKISNFYFL